MTSQFLVNLFPAESKQMVSVPATTRISTIIDNSIHSVVCEEYMGLCTIIDPDLSDCEKPSCEFCAWCNVRISYLITFFNGPSYHCNACAKDPKEYGKIPEHTIKQRLPDSEAGFSVCSEDPCAEASDGAISHTNAWIKTLTTQANLRNFLYLTQSRPSCRHFMIN